MKRILMILTTLAIAQTAMEVDRVLSWLSEVCNLSSCNRKSPRFHLGHRSPWEMEGRLAAVMESEYAYSYNRESK